MLDTFFTTVLDMTMKGSLVIIAVLLARLLLHRAPKAISYGLWLIVLLRLLCPVSIQLPVSALPEVVPVTPNYALDDTDLSFAEVGAAAIGSVEDLLSGGSGVQQIPVRPQMDPQTSVQQPQQYVSTSAKEIWILFGSYLWVSGFIVMAVYSLASTLRLKRNLREAVLVEKGVYQTDCYDTPFVIGLFAPKIYLPLGMENKERLLILTHEKQHIRRLDPLWKALGFLCLSIHWFNPLVWAAFICACRDMEMSCDEAVLKSMGEDVRGEYAASLLKITTGKRIIAGTPLTFAEGDPKGRIRNLARWKKPILWISIVTVAACSVLAVCLLTDPVRKDPACGGSVYFLGRLDSQQNDRLLLNCEDGSKLEFSVNPEFTLPENVQTGDYVMVHGRWREENRRYWISRVEKMDSPVNDNLGEAIENAILLTEGGHEKNQYACASFAEIADSRVKDQGAEFVTVYGFALHQTYTNRNGRLQETSGSHIPVAITFRVDSEAGYRLVSYWMPRDGRYYADDIQARFPGWRIPDGQRYIAAQESECEEKARNYFGNTLSGESVPTEPTGTGTGADFDISKVPAGGSLPLEELPDDYGREDAIRDGVVVMEYESAFANTDAWEAFVDAVEQKTPARVRVMNCRVGMRMYLDDILFDGRCFMLRQPVYYTDGRLSEVRETEFSYLASFQGELKADGVAYERYVRYGLCMQDPGDVEPEWEQWHVAGTEPIVVFQYRTEYKSYPEIPDTLVSAKLMLENMTLGTVLEREKLESLRNMIAQAEFVPKGDANWPLEELYLDLTFGDGTKMRASLFPETDRLMINGKAYDYGPWNAIRNDEYPADYNALLDLVRHFGLEDWPPEFRQWCIDRGIEPPRHSLKVLVGEQPHP